MTKLDTCISNIFYAVHGFLKEGTWVFLPIKTLGHTPRAPQRSKEQSCPPLSLAHDQPCAPVRDMRQEHAPGPLHWAQPCPAAARLAPEAIYSSRNPHTSCTLLPPFPSIPSRLPVGAQQVLETLAASLPSGLSRPGWPRSSPWPPI